jgi:hypothetical protein
VRMVHGASRQRTRPRAPLAPLFSCSRKGCAPYVLIIGSAAAESRAHIANTVPLRGRTRPYGSVASPRPYRSASAGTEVVNSISWSLNRNLRVHACVCACACARACARACACACAHVVVPVLPPPAAGCLPALRSGANQGRPADMC